MSRLSSKLRQIHVARVKPSAEPKATGFEIFSPLVELHKSSLAAIATYGLSSPEVMAPVVEPLIKLKAQVFLLVGYSKRSHDLVSLLGTLRQYRSLGWVAQNVVLPDPDFL